MTKNPILNAAAAIVYIAALVSLMFYAPVLFGFLKLEQIPQIFAGITALSIFVFSAATMGYLFLYNPILLILENKKKEGTMLFLQTVAAFGVGSFCLVLAGLVASALLK